MDVELRECGTVWTVKRPSNGDGEKPSFSADYRCIYIRCDTLLLVVVGEETRDYFPL